MPVGVAIPGALPLDGVGVGPLADADLPLPDSEAFAIFGRNIAGAGTLADPRPDAFAKAGLRGPAFDLIYHDRIHIFPRWRDLGSVVSEQEIDVEVWNAYLQRANILDDITVTGPAGIEVVDDLGLPAHFPATQSHVYVVEVSAEGDPQIDNLITWVFVDIDDTGTGLRVLGFRLIPFPFDPNMSSAISETFGYLTDVIAAGFDGTEQRVQLRAVPVGTITYAVFLSAVRDAQMAAAILFGNQPRAYGVGRWQFQTPVTVAASVDDVDVYCVTTDIPFEVGGLIMLWIDPYRWEVLTIDSVAADHVVVTSPLRFAWPAIETAVLPVVVGRLSTEEVLSWESLAAVSQTLTFDIDGFTP